MFLIHGPVYQTNETPAALHSRRLLDLDKRTRVQDEADPAIAEDCGPRQHAIVFKAVAKTFDDDLLLSKQVVNEDAA